MIYQVQVRVTLEEERISQILNIKAAQQLGFSVDDISGIKILRKSIDARAKTILFNYKIEASVNKGKYINLISAEIFFIVITLILSTNLINIVRPFPI